MQEKGKEDGGFGPLGICHRLFNFIMNSFITRGTRSITLGKNNAAAPLHESRAVEGSHKDREEVISRNAHELQVEFRHTNGSIVNRTKNISGQGLVQENKNSTQTRKTTDFQDQGKGNGGNGKAKKSTLTIVEGGYVPRRRPHLLSVASNINEKADAFIRSRKEAMEKTLSMNQTTDV